MGDLPTIQTANVLVDQVVKITYENGDTAQIRVPSGSVVLSPAYFARLSESMAIKDKLLSEGNLTRPGGIGALKLEKRLYIDTYYGVNSGPEFTIGGRMDLML